MRFVCKLALGLTLLAPTLSGSTLLAQQSPRATAMTGMEIGRPPFLVVATAMCGPLEPKEPFDPKTFGQVRGTPPIRAYHPPLVLFTTALTPEFFRLATALDALIAADPTWSNSLVVVSEEKGAQVGGYTADEILERRKSISRLAEQNHITHLSFFLTAQGAKGVTPRLELADKQDILLAVLDNKEQPRMTAPILSVQRLESGKLTSEACKKIVDNLTSPKK